MIRWLFASSWRRSALALLVLLGIFIYLGLLYIDAVAQDNQRRIDEYGQRVGASTAAQLWALRIERRDPAWFTLRDSSLVHQSGLLSGVEDQQEGEGFLTGDQRQQLMKVLEESDPYRPPEVVDWEWFSPENMLPIIGVLRNWHQPHPDEVPLDLEQQMLRWQQGLELSEALTGGRTLVDELIRYAHLESSLEISRQWLALLNADQLDRIAVLLARIEPPQQGITRAMQIETLATLDYVREEIEVDMKIWWPQLPFDLRCYLDRQLSWSLDPTDEDLIEALAEPPPFYAPMTKVTSLQVAKLGTKTTRIEAMLRVTRAAFAAMLAIKRGQEWQPPEGIERIVSSDGTVRIRTTKGPEGTDIYLPR